VTYRLLTEFQNLFDSKAYIHRNSSLGDFVAMHLYEDLVTLDRSNKLKQRVISKDWILNTQNKRQGIKARRGDGTFGEIVPNEKPILDSGYQVARGKVATIEIGAEVKILAKAMSSKLIASLVICKSRLLNLSAAVVIRCVSRLWELITLCTQWAMKAIERTERMAKVIVIRFKKQQKPNDDCWQMPLLSSTNSFYFHMQLLTSHLFPSHGSIIR
jgi:hypothetical protein